MNAEQFWLLVLVVVIAAGIALLVRKLSRRGLDPGGVADWARRGVAGVRGMPSLDVLPRLLVDQAVRQARPLPAGRHMPTVYHLRCGVEMYAAVHPYWAEVVDSFVAGAAEFAYRNRWRFDERHPTLELDESLPPTSYRFDCEFDDTGRSPVGGRKVTDLFDGGAANRVNGSRMPHNSGWVVMLPGERPFPVPVDGSLTVGAAGECDIIVTNRYVSGVHVTLSAEGPDLVVVDGDGRQSRSRNGTRVNGHAVRSVRLGDGDADTEVCLGPEVKLTIVRAGAQTGTRP